MSSTMPLVSPRPVVQVVPFQKNPCPPETKTTLPANAPPGCLPTAAGNGETLSIFLASSGSTAAASAYNLCWRGCLCSWLRKWDRLIERLDDTREAGGIFSAGPRLYDLRMTRGNDILARE